MLARFKRIAGPNEFARVISLLVSADGSCVIGAVLVADGGHSFH